MNNSRIEAIKLELANQAAERELLLKQKHELDLEVNALGKTLTKKEVIVAEEDILYSKLDDSIIARYILKDEIEQLKNAKSVYLYCLAH